MKNRKKDSINIIHVLAVPSIFVVVFALLYLKFRNTSGGDIALTLFSVIFLTIYTFIMGAYSYSWEFRQKRGLILGLFATYLIAYILFEVTVG